MQKLWICFILLIFATLLLSTSGKEHLYFKKVNGVIESGTNKPSMFDLQRSQYSRTDIVDKIHKHYYEVNYDKQPFSSIANLLKQNREINYEKPGKNRIVELHPYEQDQYAYGVSLKSSFREQNVVEQSEDQNSVVNVVEQPEDQDNGVNVVEQPGDQDNDVNVVEQPGDQDNGVIVVEQPGDQDNEGIVVEQPGDQDNSVIVVEQPGDQDNGVVLVEEPGDQDNGVIVVEQPGDQDNGDVNVVEQPGNVIFTTCDATITPLVSCYDCNTRMICKDCGAMLIPCKTKLKPYCRFGICSSRPGGLCVSVVP